MVKFDIADSGQSSISSSNNLPKPGQTNQVKNGHNFSLLTLYHTQLLKFPVPTPDMGFPPHFTYFLLFLLFLLT